MGLTINMCNDVEKYEEAVMGGFTLKKTLYVILDVIAGGGTMAISYFLLNIPILASVFIMIPVVILVVSKGFFEGGSGSLIKEILLMKKKRKPLTYQSTEVAMASAVTVRKEEDGKEKGRRKLRNK